MSTGDLSFPSHISLGRWLYYVVPPFSRPAFIPIMNRWIAVCGDSFPWRILSTIKRWVVIHVVFFNCKCDILCCNNILPCWVLACSNFQLNFYATVFVKICIYEKIYKNLNMFLIFFCIINFSTNILLELSHFLFRHHNSDNFSENFSCVARLNLPQKSLSTNLHRSSTSPNFCRSSTYCSTTSPKCCFV